MAALRTLTIIAATLLVVAGAGAGGYHYANQNSSGETSTTLVENTAEQAPQPFQHIGRAFEMQAAGGEGCRVDLETKSLGCTYADGVKQIASFDEIAETLTTRTITPDESCEESTSLLGDLSNELLMNDADANSDEDDDNSSVTLVTDTKRVKVWEVSIPKGLLTDSTIEDGSFQYFEKDGKPWKIEAFEEGKSDPLVVDMSTTTGGLDENWASYGHEGANDGTCEEAPEERRLFEHVASSASESSSRALTGRKLQWQMMAFGPALGIMIFSLIAGILAGFFVAKKCGGGCRRRARQLLRGPEESNSAINWEAVGRVLQSAAAVSAAVTVAKAGIGADEDMNTDALMAVAG